ncbi:MAG: S1C family serine protease [Ruminococcus sp.]|jgi:serine protease Do|nr:S1C family serine protease [Ruminococcus sp.]
MNSTNEQNNPADIAENMPENIRENIPESVNETGVKPPENPKEAQKRSIMPFLLLICLMLIALCVLIIIKQSETQPLETTEPPTAPLLPYNDGAGITVNIPQISRPKLSEDKYADPETGLFTQPGLAEFILPTQVSITVYNDDLIFPSSFATGTIFTEDGYIITNAHVVDGAVKISVTDYEGNSDTAEIIGYDGTSDLALIKTDLTGLTPVTFGKSSECVLGEAVACTGRSAFYDNCVNFGNLVNLDRVIDTDYINSENFHVFQVSCFINNGASGGPVFNMYGQCIAVVSTKYVGEGYEGIGFALPADNVVPVVEDMLAGGYSTTAVWTGLTLERIDAEAAEYADVPYGMAVKEIETETSNPAIKNYDIITKIDDTQIITKNSVEKALSGKKIGETVTLTVYRPNGVSGAYFETELTLIQKKYFPRKAELIESDGGEIIAPEADLDGFAVTTTEDRGERTEDR